MDRLDICFFMDKPESKAQQISIDELGALSMVLAELEPNTDYSFFFIPRGKGVVGRPSNMKSVKTLEDGKFFFHFKQGKTFRISEKYSVS